VSERPHTQMVRAVHRRRPCSAGKRLELYRQRWTALLQAFDADFTLSSCHAMRGPDRIFLTAPRAEEHPVGHMRILQGMNRPLFKARWTGEVLRRPNAELDYRAAVCLYQLVGCRARVPCLLCAELITQRVVFFLEFHQPVAQLE